MRILAAIPHFFDPMSLAGDGRRHGSVARDPGPRVEATSACIAALHQQIDRSQSIIDIARKTTRPANAPFSGTVDVVVCTTRGRHLLDDVAARLDDGMFSHRETDADPLFLGLECRKALRERLGSEYDYYCYLEDDLIVRDPWFFAKLSWFNGHLGPDRLLLPHRFEVGRRGIVKKVYIDGDLADHVLAQLGFSGADPTLRSMVLGREVAFQKPRNPHSGCYFLGLDQMRTFADREGFLDRDSSFIGPLESVATLGIVRAFQVFKPSPENAGFLEIEHHGTDFLGLIRSP